MYSEYINNYNNAIETMSRCLEESEEFRDFLQQGRNDPETRGLDVTSFMILPIQRVPRYQLLLEDLLRRTDESHPDHGNISQAVVAIKGTAEVRQNSSLSLSLSRMSAPSVRLLIASRGLCAVPQRGQASIREPAQSRVDPTASHQLSGRMLARSAPCGVAWRGVFAHRSDNVSRRCSRPAAPTYWKARRC